MTTRLLILLAAVLLCWAAPAQGQTIKSLGFNTTNGNIVYAGTNVLTFTNALAFGTNAAATRTNLGLGGFRKTDGEVFAEIYSGEDLRIVAGDSIAFYEGFGFGGTNAAAFASDSRASLGLGLPALTNTSNVTTMRALAGSTNTNQPFSGTVALTNTNVLTFSNGVLLKIQ